MRRKDIFVQWLLLLLDIICIPAFILLFVTVYRWSKMVRRIKVLQHKTYYHVIVLDEFFCLIIDAIFLILFCLLLWRIPVALYHFQTKFPVIFSFFSFFLFSEATAPQVVSRKRIIWTQFQEALEDILSLSVFFFIALCFSWRLPNLIIQIKQVTQPNPTNPSSSFLLNLSPSTGTRIFK
jgi:hypothetical protein